MKDHKVKVNELKHITISNEGKYYRSTKISTASTKEHTCARATSLLLMSEDRSPLDNDEVIFSNEIVGDRSAGGGLTFIGRLCEIIGPKATNLAKVVPGIGRFTK